MSVLCAVRKKQKAQYINKQNLRNEMTQEDHLKEIMDERDKKYMQMFKASQDAVSAALAAVHETNNKAEMAAEKRFESVNEFRSTLSDQASRLLPRSEYDSAHNSLSERVRELSARVDRQEGSKSGVNSAWLYLVGFVSLLSSTMAIFIAFSNNL
jgi:multidrug efflux pump subunit AcrB